MVKEKPSAPSGRYCSRLFPGRILAPSGAVPLHLPGPECHSQPSSGRFLLGTDNLGRDLLSRIIYGARISMYVGLSVPPSDCHAPAYRGVSSYLGGKFDLMVQRFVDSVMCFPGLVLMLTVVAIVARGCSNSFSCWASWRPCGGNRVTRSVVIGIKQNV